MNILLIGNGFDLAHGLPTKYLQFLEFCKRVFPIYENTEGRGVELYQQDFLYDWNFSEGIKKALIDAYESRKKIVKNRSQIKTEYPRLDEMYLTIKNNFWIEYFLQCPMYQKKNWIGFESEISKVIQSIDADMKDNNLKLDDGASIVSNFYVEKFFHKQLPSAVLDYGQKVQIITFKEIRDILHQDLNRLIRAFEIYLCEYVERIRIEKISKEIRDCGIDHVISFNYSHTYQELYGKSKNIKYNYIHGETHSENTIETNNMVLGIDEYLHKDNKDKEIEFIAFKKYYQRIYKETGSEYKNWVDEIKCSRYANEVSLREQFPRQIPYEKFNSKHKLYIFGHSLDITDRDVLRDLILNDNVYTKIYYLNKSVMGQQIANLVKVIGQDELIRRTGGSTKTIEFKLQQDMVDRK